MADTSETIITQIIENTGMVSVVIDLNENPDPATINMSRDVSPNEEAPVVTSTTTYESLYEIAPVTAATTIWVSYTTSAATTIHVHDRAQQYSHPSMGNRKPPFPGNFVKNCNRQACVAKIQAEMSREDINVLVLIIDRNTWFEKKINNE